MNLFSIPKTKDTVKVGDIVESIHCEGKIKVQKKFEDFVIGEDLNGAEYISLQTGDVVRGIKILSYHNMK